MTYQKVLEATEPVTEPTTRYDVSFIKTPWGPAQTATQHGYGIIMYTTMSHGGFYVSPELLKQMPAYLRNADRYADGNAGWFEEDCACAIVVICFPERFPVQWRESAMEIMRSVYPEQWKQFCESH